METMTTVMKAPGGEPGAIATKPKGRTRRSRSEIEGLLHEQEKSGLSMLQFCKERGICYGNFLQWKRRSREESQAQKVEGVGSRMIPVRLTTGASGSASLEVVLGNGRALRVPAGYDEEILLRLIQTLEQMPCSR